jgi:hypothetical protein
MIVKSRSLFPRMLALSIALIFGTSCTVIRLEQFFRMIQRLTGAHEEAMRGFSWF